MDLFRCLYDNYGKQIQKVSAFSCRAAKQVQLLITFSFFPADNRKRHSYLYRLPWSNQPLNAGFTEETYLSIHGIYPVN